MSEVHVTGLKELYSFLQVLPPTMERNIMRGALLAGAKVIRDEAKNNVPVGEPSTRGAQRYGGYAGALRDSLRAGSRAKGGKVTAYIRAGGKKGRADTFYAIWAEYGTAAHWINSKSGWLTINGRRVKAPVLHPGARAQPYLRPAADRKMGDAVVSVGRYVHTRLTKQTLYRADFNVEVEE